METLLAALLAVAATVAGATAEVHNDIVQNNQATAKDALKAIIQLRKTQAKPNNVATATPPPDQTSREGRLLDLLEGMPASSARARKLSHSPSNSPEAEFAEHFFRLNALHGTRSLIPAECSAVP